MLTFLIFRLSCLRTFTVLTHFSSPVAGGYLLPTIDLQDYEDNSVLPTYSEAATELSDSYGVARDIAETEADENDIVKISSSSYQPNELPQTEEKEEKPQGVPKPAAGEAGAKPTTGAAGIKPASGLAEAKKPQQQEVVKPGAGPSKGAVSFKPIAIEDGIKPETGAVGKKQASGQTDAKKPQQEEVIKPAAGAAVTKPVAGVAGVEPVRGANEPKKPQLLDPLPISCPLQTPSCQVC